MGRLGLFVHVTAGFGDVGFCGYWTLEMFAVQPVRIYPGVPICQIFYHDIAGAITEYAATSTSITTTFSRACCSRSQPRLRKRFPAAEAQFRDRCSHR